jgi:hypothetical protein
VRGQFINDGFALAGKLYQCLDIIELSRYLAIEFETFFEAGALLKDFTGTFLIGPEIGFRDLLQQFVELMLFCAGVKETSARPRCESSTD